MLKTGIYSSEDLISNNKLKTIFGDDKEISITLYDKLRELDIDVNKADELAERVLLLFKDDRGIYKRTYAKRFESFDAILLKHVQDFFNLNDFTFKDPLVFLDVGVSDGRTSIDLFTKIKQICKNIRYIASDYNNLVYILNKNKTFITIDPNYKILEILWPPFVFNRFRLNRFLFLYPLNYIINFFIYLLVALPLIKAYKKGKIVAKKLLLFAPQVLRKAKEDSRFILKQHDLLEPLTPATAIGASIDANNCSTTSTVHLIRAMNVLNSSYFSSNQLKAIIKNLYFGLRENGLLIIGSNQDPGSLVNGAIYQKIGKSFKLLEKSGKGFILSSFVETFRVL